MPCFLAEVGGEIGDLHFFGSIKKTPHVCCYHIPRNCRSRMPLRGFKLKFTFNVVALEVGRESHHTPFSALPPPLKRVAMMRCVTYCILLQRSFAVNR